MEIPFYQSKTMLSKDFPFKLIHHTSKELKQPLHTHDYVQIAYVLGGVCKHQLRGKSLTVSRGDIFIILPGVEHSISSIEDQAFEVVLLDFMSFLVREELKPFEETLHPFFQQAGEEDSASSHQPWLHFDKGKQPLVEQLLQDIQEELEHRETGYQYAVRISLIKLLILIDREYRRALRRPASRSAQSTLVEHHPIDEVKRYVYDNYSEDIPLEHGALIANMAPAYFSHVFKKETGQTFIDFMNEVRIERAMELIRRDSHTITQIGFQVGFHHLSHFIRTFKKRTGITPTEYKKTFGQGQ